MGGKSLATRIREVGHAQRELFLQSVSDLMPVPQASMNACSASDPSARVTSSPGVIANKAMDTVFSGHS